MILISLAGYACTHFLGVKMAFPLAILLGFVVANFVPANTACSIKSPPPADVTSDALEQ